MSANTPESPAPYRPPMNLTERARRAEALAELLATSLDALRAACLLESPNRVPVGWLDALRALDAWYQHKADYDTITSNQEPHP